jgi:hypothetical protein
VAVEQAMNRLTLHTWEQDFSLPPSVGTYLQVQTLCRSKQP